MKAENPNLLKQGREETPSPWPLAWGGSPVTERLLLRKSPWPHCSSLTCRHCLCWQLPSSISAAGTPSLGWRLRCRWVPSGRAAAGTGAGGGPVSPSPACWQHPAPAVAGRHGLLSAVRYLSAAAPYRRDRSWWNSSRSVWRQPRYPALRRNFEMSKLGAWGMWIIKALGRTSSSYSWGQSSSPCRQRRCGGTNRSPPNTHHLPGAWRSPSPTCASSSMMWDTLFQPKPTNLWSYLGQSRLTTT